MSPNPTISVCMATYNGARYVKEQIESILPQLGPQDEVIVVDDASTDGTVEIVRSLKSPQISVHTNAENLGYVRTFERALSLARGDVLMLSDQDDVWVEGRARTLAMGTQDGAVVASNIVLLGSDQPLRSPLTGRPWNLRAITSRHRLRNQMRMLLGDAPYFGCTMALRRDALDIVLPFPAYLTESHDLWIATVANAAGRLVHLETATVRRRVHDSNASTSRPRRLRAVIRSRVLLLRLLFEALRRKRGAF